MAKTFNIYGACNPRQHYMVDLQSRLDRIRSMVDDGLYFSINRARQFGKTTLIGALEEFLEPDYLMISLDFQEIESEEYASGASFVHALGREILRKFRSPTKRPAEAQNKVAVLYPADSREKLPPEIEQQLKKIADPENTSVRMADLMDCLGHWCSISDKPLVLIIDEADTASNNQVFLDFLAQLRAAYLKRNASPAMQSVILAGVYDVRNIRLKLRPDSDHKQNSPWNIAADFPIDMSFGSAEIAGMLAEYESDYATGMDISAMAGIIYNYTSGYPYLVSSLCKKLDEQIAGIPGFPDRSSAWTKDGFLAALKLLTYENNSLFQSLTGKLLDYPQLRTVLYNLLFTGRRIPYVPQNEYIDVAAMFGFIRNENGFAVIANRIFETVLYNLFISEEFSSSPMYDAGERETSQFTVGGHLNMRLVLEKFTETFDFLYGDKEESFLEDAGRRYFMLFLKPIINGTGNCYVEAQTRNRERMDLVVDYRGEQFVIEMKIWRGEAYMRRGEEQLVEYLDYFHLNRAICSALTLTKRNKSASGIL